MFMNISVCLIFCIFNLNCYVTTNKSQGWHEKNPNPVFSWLNPFRKTPNRKSQREKLIIN